MRAIRMFEVGRPLRADEIPVPEIGERDVLVRVRAAGICHSDAHYRAGRSKVEPLPMTLGHEAAGVVERVGPKVTFRKVGDRVCLHYLRTCGNCIRCNAGQEQFCPRGAMLGHHAHGGYAEAIAVPERNAVLLPDEISFEHGAILMCSSATSLHALRKGRLSAGETVAVFGTGGLGISAVQLARALGALDVFAVDIDAGKLALAQRHGAIPVNAAAVDAGAEIARLTQGRGVDVALELVGIEQTMRQAVASLGVMGRAVFVGIGDAPLVLDVYREILGKEAEVIGSNDHLLSELPLLLDLARRGTLDLSCAVTRRVPLEADVVNQVLDELEGFGSGVRSVIVP